MIKNIARNSDADFLKRQDHVKTERLATKPDGSKSIASTGNAARLLVAPQLCRDTLKISLVAKCRFCCACGLQRLNNFPRKINSKDGISDYASSKRSTLLLDDI